MRVKLELPLEPSHRLVHWANGVAAFYGAPLYIVGSQLTDKDNPFDIDIVCPIPDDQFSLRYGDVNEWMQEGGTGLYSEIRWDWADDCVKRSLDAMSWMKCRVDFKVQPMCQFKGYSHIHEKFPPYRLDTRK